MLYTDVIKLKEILKNLLLNIIKFIHKREITIKVLHDKNNNICKIKDIGVCIAKKDRE